MTTLPPAPPSAAPVVPPVAVVEPASWGRRVVAAFLDDAVLVAVVWVVAGWAGDGPTLQPVFGTVEPHEYPWTASGAAVGAVLLMLVLQGLTGQTPGRRVLGIQVVRAPVGGPVGGPPGVGRSVARWFAHLLDAVLLIGYLRPLWHPERRTWADSLVGTMVVRRPPVAPGERRGRVVSALAAVVVVVGVVGSFTRGEEVRAVPVAERACVLAPQTAGSAVTVDRALLVREVTWRRPSGLLPTLARPQETRGRGSLTLELTWDPPAGLDADPDQLGASPDLVVETTTDGGVVEHWVPLADGSARLQLERAGDGPVGVTVLHDGITLTSCTALPPDAEG